MKTRPAYLVIDIAGRQPTISHVRASWPRLEPGQIVVRLAIEIPDEALPRVQTVQIEAPEAALVETLPVDVPEPSKAGAWR